MNKEIELRKYVDEYFDKYMCVSFDKFIENWEETQEFLKYYKDIVEGLEKYIIEMCNTYPPIYMDLLEKIKELKYGKEVKDE